MLPPSERPETPPGAEASTTAARKTLELSRLRQQADELERFQARVSGRLPVATCALVASIGGIFALEYAWGGVDLPPLLRSMGSLVPERLRAGEWWRYFSCTFLHGGLLHVALNTFLLLVLGRSLERCMGSARLLLVYFAAGASGSLLSSCFVSSQSVGASGAIWGLLGAEAALAFYPRPLLPPLLLRVARRAALVNLGLSLVNSFNPHVDVAAHVGGGLMGAAVLVLLAASGSFPEHGRPPRRGQTLLPVLAGALSCLFFAGLGLAQFAGRPWTLDAAPALERVPVPGSPWSAEVPRDRSPSPDNGESSFGNLAFDPSVVDISWAPLSPAAGEPDVLAELHLVQQRLAQPPEGLELLLPPRVVSDADAAGAGAHVRVRYRHLANPEVIDDRVIGFVEATLVRVDVTAWVPLPGAYEGLVQRVFGSLQRR